MLGFCSSECDVWGSGYSYDPPDPPDEHETDDEWEEDEDDEVS